MNRTLSRLAFLAAAAAFAPLATAATPVEQAQAQLNGGDLQGALKTLDRHLASSPQDAEGRFTRGLVLVKLNKTEEALKAFADLTRDYPQLPEPYNNLAVLYAQQGDYEKARDALEAALATHPAYATAHENLGDIYAALAGAAYNRALMLDQSNQTVRYKLNLVNQLDTGLVGTAPAPAAPAAKPAAGTAVPAPAATPAAAATADPGVDAVAINASLTAWAKAWSSKNVDGYLALYAPDFAPEGGLTRANWEQQRRERIARPSRIAVRALNPEISRIGADRVRVNFVQDYQSDSFSDQVNKTLELRATEAGWKIVREYIR
ncbi:tetratricopeptide repeat protein [Stagnimonas aquatica]|uniref:Tetratricopeptide repeat protein n=1 Tax=Stagnimonas aquatica TaxID=2689987 RepID=A0A3N0V106_9GAMM|nr:tetratricopeptide repeat protein [Stagnimonas aquatica]ROH86477.1 tetratricopeptide repeat protein [Stagnimonas aquatica]